MQLRDANGQTEEEFLAAYNQGDYPRPSFTADVAVVRNVERGAEANEQAALTFELLLIKRGGHPYLGCWALPGGFANPDEDADTVAARELAEETGIEGVALEQFGVYSKPGRDPRGWCVSAAYLAHVGSDACAQAGDDAADARWFAVSAKRSGEEAVLTGCCGDEQFTCRFRAVPQRYRSARAHVTASNGLAFDHADIISDAYLAIAGAQDEGL